MKYINKIDLAERWQCHPTNIDYHRKKGHVKRARVKGEYQYLLESVEKFELQYNKRVRLPLVKKPSVWEIVINFIKSKIK